MSFLRRNLVTLVGIGVSVVALYWLASSFNLADVLHSIRSANPLFLAPIPVLVILSFLLRTQRWRLLVEHEPPVRYWSSFRALMIGYLLNNVLPARAGDFARAIELGRTESMSRTKLLVTLVTERTVDLGFTLAILSVVLVAYPALPVWLKHAGWAVSALTAGAFASLLVAHVMGRRLVKWLQIALPERLISRIGPRIESMAESALEGVAGMFRLRRAVGFVGITVVIWVVEVSVVWLVARTCGLNLAPGNALFVLLAIAVGSMVPASPGFVGTYEFFGVTALKIVGISGAPALASIVLLHVVTLLGSTLLGAICFMLRAPSSGPRIWCGAVSSLPNGSGKP